MHQVSSTSLVSARRYIRHVHMLPIYRYVCATRVRTRLSGCVRAVRRASRWIYRCDGKGWCYDAECDLLLLRHSERAAARGTHELLRRQPVAGTRGCPSTATIRGKARHAATSIQPGIQRAHLEGRPGAPHLRRGGADLYGDGADALIGQARAEVLHSRPAGDGAGVPRLLLQLPQGRLLMGRVPRRASVSAPRSSHERTTPS